MESSLTDLTSGNFTSGNLTDGLWDEMTQSNYTHGNNTFGNYSEAAWDAYFDSMLPSPWTAYIYPLSVYLVGLACVVLAVNVKERWRAPFVIGFLAIGIEISRYVSGLKMIYAIKDTILKAIIIQAGGSVVMILREKFVLTEEQKRLSWKSRALASYKILWNGRFIQTPRPAPVYHLLKDGQQTPSPVHSKKNDDFFNEKAAEKSDKDKDDHGNSTSQHEVIPVTARDTIRQHSSNAWIYARHHVIEVWKSPRSHWLFWAILKVIVIININYYKDRMFWSLGGFTMRDVVPEKRMIIRRLFSGTITQREILVRCYFAFEGYWSAYHWYTRCHLSCAILFVALGIDEPEEWPPMFGDVREAWQLRRFWSKFYDRLIYRTICGWGEMIMEFTGFGNRPFRGKKRWVLNGLVFALSGLFHAQTDYLAGIHCGFWQEFLWWIYNFVAICAETAFLAALRKHRPRFYNAMSGKVGQTIGYLWVFMWLFWSVPKNQYTAMWCFPRTYH